MESFKKSCESWELSYADVVRGSVEPTNSYWRRYQAQDEDEAIDIALKESQEMFQVKEINEAFEVGAW